jgi:hypothetical protein
MISPLRMLQISCERFCWSFDLFKFTLALQLSWIIVQLRNDIEIIDLTMYGLPSIFRIIVAYASCTNRRLLLLCYLGLRSHLNGHEHYLTQPVMCRKLTNIP